jgi:hypothetical protein
VKETTFKQSVTVERLELLRALEIPDSNIDPYIRQIFLYLLGQSKQMGEQYLKIGYNRFFQRPFKIIFRSHFTCLCHLILYKNAVKEHHYGIQEAMDPFPSCKILYLVSKQWYTIVVDFHSCLVLKNTRFVSDKGLSSWVNPFRGVLRGKLV